jgi:hypothetical protein
MAGLSKQSERIASNSENIAAKNALDAVARIDQEAQERKLAQLEVLRSARGAIEARLQELQHQLEQIDRAIVAITGETSHEQKRSRRNLEDVRDKVLEWFETRRGQRLSAGDIVREFTELAGTPVSIFLKPLVRSGRIQTDNYAGTRRVKYFVP